MNCVADENVDSLIVRQLRTAGHDVWYVAEQAPGIDDDEVLRCSSFRDALLLTGDRDFGDLVFRQGKASAGVLRLRLAGIGAEEKAQLVSLYRRLRTTRPSCEARFQCSRAKP